MNNVTLYSRPALARNVFENFDDLIESFFGSDPFVPAGVSGSRVPAVDVRENTEGYLVEAELPGATEKDINVRVENRTLVIESLKEEKTEKKEEDRYVIRERRASSFSRSFTLPEDADAESVQATFKNGVLELEIKKRPEAKPRSIEVKVR
ncbi:MAG: Hsp20/alpha crystallin family protein [Treponemataceae bacterium]